MTGCIIFLPDVLTGKKKVVIKWQKQIRIIQNSKITYFCPSVACFLSKIIEVIISVNPDGSTGWRTALQFICQKCQIGCQISAFGKCVSRISAENDLPVTCGGQWGAKAPFLGSFRCRCNWKWRKISMRVVYFIVIYVLKMRRGLQASTHLTFNTALNLGLDISYTLECVLFN